ARLLGAGHRILPQHRRDHLVSRVGPVPDGRSRVPARHSGVPAPGAVDQDEGRTTGMTFHVDSEIGRLRQVILHRPGLELGRLTPTNVESLLFDDILWAKRAREEHDAFAQVLRDRGVTVHYFRQLLAETLAIPAARAGILERVINEDTVGPTLVEPLRQLADDADADRLADLLIGGVLKSDLAGLVVNSLRWELMHLDDFVLTPLPNHLFQRDNSAWIYHGVSINPMAMEARIRESVHSAAIYRFHPMFTDSRFTV